MYKTIPMTEKRADEIRNGPDKANWIHFCENNNGTCYWNKRTGEIMWIPNDDTLGNFSKIITA